MAQRSGLFDSTEIVQTIDGYPQGNRAETADFFAKYFSNFIGNGVFMEASTSFQVLAAGGMKVTVKKGSCFIEGYMAFDNEDEVFTLTAGHTHWFVQRAHIISGGDITKTWIVDAAEGELPLRDGAYYDLLIAKVVIPSGATAITDGMITDYRYDKNLCGAVTSLKPSVVPTLPDDVLKYVSDSMFRTVGGTSVGVGNAKIATGSYIGTGTSYPSLVLPFEPIFLAISSSRTIHDGSFDSMKARGSFYTVNGIGVGYIIHQNSSSPARAISKTLLMKSTFNDNQMSWECIGYAYSNNSGNLTTIESQNEETATSRMLFTTINEKYLYMAIG